MGKIEDVDTTINEHKNEKATGKKEKRKSFGFDISETNNAIDHDLSEEIGGLESGNAGSSNKLELQPIQTINEKVIPLFTPEDAVVKVFMIHGSQKSALALGSFALGFQQQVTYAYMK